MTLQKHERAALDAARSVLGDAVTFHKGRRGLPGELRCGTVRSKVAVRSADSSEAARQARRWAEKQRNPE